MLQLLRPWQRHEHLISQQTKQFAFVHSTYCLRQLNTFSSESLEYCPHPNPESNWRKFYWKGTTKVTILQPLSDVKITENLRENLLTDVRTLLSQSSFSSPPPHWSTCHSHLLEVRNTSSGVHTRPTTMQATCLTCLHRLTFPIHIPNRTALTTLDTENRASNLEVRPLKQRHPFTSIPALAPSNCLNHISIKKQEKMKTL